MMKPNDIAPLSLVDTFADPAAEWTETYTGLPGSIPMSAGEAESAEGASTAIVIVAASASGIAKRQSGSTDQIAITDEGAGRKLALGGFTAGVSIAADGDGVAKQIGSGTSDVDVFGEGSGRKRAIGDATAPLLVAGEGAGGQHTSSGSESVVTVAASASGHKHATEGVTVVGAVVDADGSGAAWRRQAAESDVVVAGIGEGLHHAFGASLASVGIVAEGSGFNADSEASGASTAVVAISSMGVGASVIAVELPRIGGHWTMGVPPQLMPTLMKVASGGSIARLSIESEGVGRSLRSGSSVGVLAQRSIAVGVKRTSGEAEAIGILTVAELAGVFTPSPVPAQRPVIEVRAAPMRRRRQPMSVPVPVAADPYQSTRSSAPMLNDDDEALWLLEAA